MNRTIVACALAAALCACAGGGAMPQGALLEPDARHAAYLPDDTERAAARLAAAAIGEDPTAARAELAAFETTERLRDATGEPPSRLAPYAQHAVDAAADDAIAYRQASRALLDRDDLDPALRKEVEMEVADDPISLADERIGDSRHIRFARVVNAFSAAIGRSIFTSVLAPFRLAQAAVSVAVDEHLDDPLTLQERQALVHWKRYVDEYPDTPEAHELLGRIEEFNAQLFATKRRRSARAAEQSLEYGQNELALLLAERALRYAPDDSKARRLRDTAEERLDEQRAERAKSLAVSDAGLLDAGDARARALSVALLANGDVVAESDALLAEEPAPPLAAAAELARANALGEAGQEQAMWDALDALASGDADAPPAAREAESLVTSPMQNPWEGFQAARRGDVKQTAAAVAFGPLARGARDRDLPRTVEWLLEAPTLLPVLGGIPWRLVQVGFAPPESKAPAIAAERYLDRFPNGEHANELRHWLIDHEIERKRYVRAYALATETPDYDPEKRAELAEEAAKQALEMAERQKRRDLRFAILQSTAERFPDTESGREAAEKLTELLENASEQRIRIARSYLEENPVVAGNEGIGLRPELLDGDLRNGELHGDGVTLLGGRAVEIAMVRSGGDQDDDPEKVRETISAERLSRLVSLLEQTASRNALLDPLAEQDADATRDYFFERARLGVADAPDPRPTAESTFAFVGVSEKYNMVRSRESILPVELVLSGSLPDLGLGAFPRIRMPKETPDAVLYR